ncbi:hypothetical protein JOC86_004338 [Bacillus pakistanensis]|uniref:GNAT family N-acetyltransferase n=1 Tax=Rossellomorea pakistanensis TaxID=992288 RepID=A0ABS2NJ14_9BACI|nr:hypothetical protein [Bacillus pakistanensis]MBM7587764.1 hypothetical protein [Bacillus pakistanensis]
MDLEILTKTAGAFVIYQGSFVFQIDPTKQKDTLAIVELGGRRIKGEAPIETAEREVREEAAMNLYPLSAPVCYYKKSNSESLQQMYFDELIAPIVILEKEDHSLSVTYLVESEDPPVPSGDTSGIIILTPEEIHTLCEGSWTLEEFKYNGGRVIEGREINKNLPLKPFPQIHILSKLLKEYEGWFQRFQVNTYVTNISDGVDKTFRSNIYQKVKSIVGENFVTFEDTKYLTENEMKQFIDYILEDSMFSNKKFINVLVHRKFSRHIDQLLIGEGFYLHDEFIMVYKDLKNHFAETSPFTFKSLELISEGEFKSVWKGTMEQSLNAPSSLTMDEQMENVKIELGEGYRKSCVIAYEEGRPIGVVMPHIEPGTEKEGRLFYFGLLKAERGKGKSIPLHKQALSLLKDDFKADDYIGGTSIHNLPMQKIFNHNDCKVVETNKVYKMKR